MTWTLSRHPTIDCTQTKFTLVSTLARSSRARTFSPVPTLSKSFYYVGLIGLFVIPQLFLYYLDTYLFLTRYLSILRPSFLSLSTRFLSIYTLLLNLKFNIEKSNFRRDGSRSVRIVWRNRHI